jgi:Activator of Hsp90 ATPase homolog 1-like protein
MPETAEKALLRKSIRVQVPIERAFSLFIEQMETWWPATHHIAPQPFQSIIIEPRVGGRWYERDTHGNDCTWGFVRAWDPPRFVTLSWHLQEDWSFHPDLAHASDVDLSFTAEGPHSTLVELTHYNLERHGEAYATLRDQLDGPGAWSFVLDEYVKGVNKETQP